MTAEFHATNVNALEALPRPQPAGQAYHGKPYKAIVIFYMEGGVDSFNVLMPHSECRGAADLRTQYEVPHGL